MGTAAHVASGFSAVASGPKAVLEPAECHYDSYEAGPKVTSWEFQLQMPPVLAVNVSSALQQLQGVVQEVLAMPRFHQKIKVDWCVHVKRNM